MGAKMRGLFFSFVFIFSLFVVTQARTSFKIYVTKNKENKSTEVTVKAHLLQDLLEFFELDYHEDETKNPKSNFSDIVKLLSTIPHNISVDLATAAAEKGEAWVLGHLPRDKPLSRNRDMENIFEPYTPPPRCVDYVPTYLLTFDRADIIEEFGSEYFLLPPSKAKKGKLAEELTKELVTSLPPLTMPPPPPPPPPPPRLSSSSSTLLPFRRPPPPPPQPPRSSSNQKSRMWLHVPKTGSSFISTAENLGFEDVSHDPCRPGSSCEMITLLRNPGQRMISWFYYEPSLFEKCIVDDMAKFTVEEYKASIQICFNKFMAKNIYDGSDSTTLFWGCQAKMLSGYHCDDAWIPSTIRSDEMLTNYALTKMKDESSFKFIGNIDFYDASVTLAHQMLGGEISLVNAFEKVNSRMQNDEHREHTFTGNKELDDIRHHSDFLCENNNKYCKNLPDEAVYQEMKKMMLDNILKHHNNEVRVFSQPLRYELPFHTLNRDKISCPKSISNEMPLRYALN
jgi:hypothetical protein